jgi:hypothetical protein
MAKTKAELLLKRFRPIFVGGKHYPGSKFSDGVVQETEVESKFSRFEFFDTNGVKVQQKIDDIELYPHLFRKLDWHEDRGLGELPEYVLLLPSKNGTVYRVREWCWIKDFGVKMILEDGKTRIRPFSDIYPATRSEYLAFKRKKK